jgi:flagellar hook-length control protein FliK
VPDAKGPSADDAGKPPARADASDGADDKTAENVSPGAAKPIQAAQPGHAEPHQEVTPNLAGQNHAAGATGEQHQADAAKPNGDALPNFGFPAANAAATATASNAAPSVTASTPTAVPTPTVPIAGLAIEIAARAQAGVNRFDIRLDPPELGRIDVRLDVNRDGRVTSHVTVDRPETLTLLQHDQPHLERALEQAGLKTADNGLQFTLRDQSFTGQNHGGRSGQNAARLVVPDADSGVIEATSSRYRLLGTGGGIDISV